MDATRSRRTRDRARQHWYAEFRSFRFARHLGFIRPDRASEKPPDRRTVTASVGAR